MSKVYIINEDNGRKCFKLQKGARQSDSVPAYLFALCLEIVFILIKWNKRVKGINILKAIICIPLTQTILTETLLLLS